MSACIKTCCSKTACVRADPQTAFELRSNENSSGSLRRMVMVCSNRCSRRARKSCEVSPDCFDEGEPGNGVARENAAL